MPKRIRDPIKRAAATLKWRLTHPEHYKAIYQAANVRRQSNPNWKQYNHERHVRKRREDKLAAFNAYGGPICVCCGETEVAFLSLDHINNDGNVYRRTSRHSGNWYRRLAIEGFPPGLQILCMNCNFGKHINKGVCPHVVARQQGGIEGIIQPTQIPQS